ncbi:hypothetical protein H6P81_013489 [Aristolochia fimbriata]|uniref:Uncharacterized protein n=1 Tax=Aristolochia fimbriata TaxID=158543 RepID=A0AAV7EI19_ARIFI|nr:hypothetical protein H6P81_013489 [Aristolochia fimbriata]
MSNSKAAASYTAGNLRCSYYIGGDFLFIGLLPVRIFQVFSWLTQANDRTECAGPRSWDGVKGVHIRPKLGDSIRPWLPWNRISENCCGKKWCRDQGGEGLGVKGVHIRPKLGDSIRPWLPWNRISGNY